MNKVTLQIPLSTASFLEGRLLFQEGSDRNEGVLICPPHPLLAGNIENNIVQAVAKLAAESMPVLIFNYQAVGKSYKPAAIPLFEHWQLLDQQNDYRQIIQETKIAIQYSHRYFTNIHLVGYSFGAFIAHHCLDQNCLSFTAIAPPLAEHAFTPLKRDLPTMTIWADNDELITPRLDDLFLENSTNKVIKDTDHFFISHEEEVAKLIIDFIGQNLCIHR